MTHKLGVYFASHHGWQSSWDYIARLQPPVIRLLLPGDAPTELVSRVHRTVPNATIALRWWDVDDGGEGNKRGKLADPERSAEQDAITYLARIETMEQEAKLNGLPFPPRRQLRVNALNEPPTWEHDKRPAIVRYNVRLIERMKPHRVPVYAGCLAVGHPEEWPPVWEWAQPMIDAIKGLPGSALELHEYWQLEGPNHVWGDGTRKDWGALAGRYQRCPFNVPIVIGECGADGRLYDRKPRHTGWVGNIAPETYAGQLGWYLGQIDRDRRIVAALPFLTDYQADEWGTFDTTGAHDAILRMIAQRPTAPASEEHSVHIPVVGGPTPPPKAEKQMGIINPMALEAILAVESGHNAYGPEGKLLIRFEAHIFRQYLGNDGLWAKHFRHGAKPWEGQQINPDGAGPWFDIHTGKQVNEYQAFNLAISLNRHAAYMAISMGAPQIMGFNHARIGFDSAQAMYARFSQSWYAQVIALINFCLGDPALVTALNNLDWRSVARIYNGPGNVDYAAPRYEQAYRKLAGV
jgi:hypothetical protein